MKKDDKKELTIDEMRGSIPTTAKKGLRSLIERDPEMEEALITSKHDQIVEVALKHYLSTYDMDMKGRVSAKQVIPVTKLYIFDRHFNVPLLHDIATQFLRLTVSEGGKGRKELTEIVRSTPSGFDEPFNPASLKDRLFGK